jgi:hypothetical protein
MKKFIIFLSMLGITAMPLSPVLAATTPAKLTPQEQSLRKKLIVVKIKQVSTKAKIKTNKVQAKASITKAKKQRTVVLKKRAVVKKKAAAIVR